MAQSRNVLKHKRLRSKEQRLSKEMNKTSFSRQAWLDRKESRTQKRK